MSPSLLLDEMMSPSLVARLWALDIDTVHIQHRAMLHWPDHEIWKYAVVEKRCVVTANARDFRALAARTDRHPGVLAVPGSGTRDEQFAFVRAAIAWAQLQARTGPSPFGNRIVDVSAALDVTYTDVPAPDPGKA